MAVVYTENIAVPITVTGGTETVISHLAPPLWLLATGTFTATYQVQLSPDDSGSRWFDEGSALTAAGALNVTKPARRMRLNCTAYTSGTPIFTVSGVYANQGG